MILNLSVLRCLQNLARIAQSSKNRTPLDRLRFRCPSCRKANLARPILRRKAAINFALRELMDEWFESPYSSGSVHCIKLRSVSCQTEYDSSSNVVEDNKTFLNLKIHHSVTDDTETDTTIADENNISQTEYREVLFHKINGKSSLDNLPKQELTSNESSSPFADEHGGASEDNSVTSSSEGEESEQDLPIAPLFGTLRIVNEDPDVLANRPRFTRFHVTSVSGVLAFLFTELSIIYQGIRNSRSRTILTIFWFLYGGLIVYISRSFLPWMTFYTVIYFIIIYAEMSPSPLFR
ncbi:uncharacterized protein LOC123528879 isoform X2 [Mercenaria mercenaria]|uniref:uncharacterized protein LOC123528879 isoform X2 n=1 Tax=Mercenaria mercenaria TaxID=6596 RepID=UPI00234E4E05|nr:uncharacterized protein LOC123528879 isoform X2 [Mercenaria mercenaria]XP_053377588.1 uncharacterized protein LOC123528879 isoform X2 [Mercenaria mercenaria]